MGVGVGWVWAGRWTGTAVGKGCEGGPEEVGRNVAKGGKDLKDLGGGTGESVQCPGMPRRSRRRPLRPTYVWNGKRREKPGRFGRQGRLGKGAWAATSKGPRGIPGQLGLCALQRAPEPGVDSSCCVAGPHTKTPNGPPPSPTWTLGVWGTGRARESPLAPRDSFQGLCLAARGVPTD